jgi:hypothetical protein
MRLSLYKFMFCSFLFIFFTSSAYSSEIECNGFKFEKGQKGFLISNDINLRNSPNLKSNKVSTLPFGADIEITSIDKECLNIGGNKGFWLEVDATVKPKNVNARSEKNIGKFNGWIFSSFVVVKEMFQKVNRWNEFKSYNVEYGDSRHEYRIDKEGSIKSYHHDTYDGDGNVPSTNFSHESHLYQYKNYFYISYNKVIRYGKSKYCNLDSYNLSENSCYGENYIEK